MPAKINTYEVDPQMARETGIPVGVRFVLCADCGEGAEMTYAGPATAAQPCEMCGVAGLIH